MRTLPGLLCLLLLPGCTGSNHSPSPPARAELTPSRDDIDITASVRIKPGVYRIADANGDGVLRVQADNVTIDMTGVTFIGSPDDALPDTFEGTAVRAVKRTGVHLIGGAFRGYRGGIYLQDCADAVVEGADVSDNRAQRLKSTPSRCDDGADWLAPHFNDGNEWWTLYGAGITLDRCRNSSVTACRGRRTQNGIVLRNTVGSYVTGNDMSWMSGWGLALWRSSGNEISHNRFDYCVRGYSFGRYDRGQDSAGILMFEQCNENVIAYNSATHGGDGIFMYAGHETTQRTGEGGCNRNLLYRNDFSFAVANAIECTFSDGNRFLENILSGSNYGVWAGYSFNTVISGNACLDERIAGVAIEHGHHNTIEGNVFENCRTGVEVWWDEDADLLGGVYGRKRHGRSEDITIALNRFRKCALGLRVERTADVSVLSNEFEACGRVADLKGDCAEFSFDFNRILGTSPGWFRNDMGAPLRIGPCLWKDAKPADTEDVTYALGPVTLNLDFGKLEHLIQPPNLRGSRPPTWSVDLLSRTEAPAPVSGAGTAGPLIREELPKMDGGMKSIVVDEWGPCDPAVAKLFPARQTAWGEAEFFVFGPEGTWKVVETKGGEIKEDSGTVPGKVTVVGRLSRNVDEFSFTIETSAGARLKASGVVLRAEWSVQLRPWKPADGEHGGYAKRLDEKGWAKLMQERPAVRVTLPSLHNPWEGQAITPDHFATVATTTMELPAGNWRFTTTSDDGVRVFVDGKKIIDHWDWHAPAEDSATVLLNSGAHEIVVEHFEIDGAEALDLAIEPVK